MKIRLVYVVLMIVILLSAVGSSPAVAQDGGPGYLHIGSTAETPFVRGENEWIKTTITNYNLPPQEVEIRFEEYHFQSFHVQNVEVWDENGQVLCQGGFPCSTTVYDGIKVYVQVNFKSNPPKSWYKKYQDGDQPTDNSNITMQDVGVLRVKYYNPYWLEIFYNNWYTYTGPYTIGVNEN